MVTYAEKDGDDAEFAREVVAPPQRPGEVEWQGVELQILTDQVGTDQQHQHHCEKDLGSRGTAGSE